MKLKTGLTLFITVLALNTFAQNELIEKINNKTWFEDNGFAGTTVVFYETSNGLLKAIKQINGSGVPVVSSGIYDVEINQNTIFLFNGLNLNTSEKLEAIKYKFKHSTGQIISLRIVHKEPVLFTWTTKRKNITTKIDVQLLSDIVINKNEIYEEENLVKLLVDK